MYFLYHCNSCVRNKVFTYFYLLFWSVFSSIWIKYLVGPYCTSPKLIPVPSLQCRPLLALFFKCSRSNSHRQTKNAGPFNTISQQITPFRAQVIRTKKVSPNGGKYGPDKLQIQTLFTQYDFL